VASEYRGIEVFGRRPRRRADPPPRRANSRPRRSGLGIVTVLAGVVTVVGTVVGITSAMAGRYESGILLAYLSTATSVIAVLGGAAAVVMGRGRGWGALAILLGILASPPVLTRLLGWASGLG
jgi:hypothetical protein